MKISWNLALICVLQLVAVNIPSVHSFLFRRKNVHHVVNDPFQVKTQNITRDNLFAWLNMENHIKFKLWTRANPKMAHEIRIGDVESLRTSNFDPRRLTKIIVHGYAHSANEIYLEDWIVDLRDAFLYLADFNVMIIDYTLFALPAFYWTAASDLAARRLTAMIKFLLDNKQITLEGLHLLGFSWGAHIAGVAGWSLGGRIGRITGLDPAQPTFRLEDNTRRLDKDDAMFVDIIHTNSGRAFMEGYLGLGIPLGHVDYYPNSGRTQPGCPLQWTYAYDEIECDHARSVNFYSESILSPLAFPACACDSWDHYVRGECPCEADKIVGMGEHAPHTTRGKFYLFTRDKKPFGLGPHVNISLPNIDQYDPDFNNTGYHDHLRPFGLKNEPHVPLVSSSLQNLPSSLYENNNMISFHPETYVPLTNNHEPNAYLEPQSSYVVKSVPMQEYSFISYGNNQLDPSNNFRRHSLTENNSTSATAKTSNKYFDKSSRQVQSIQREPAPPKHFERFSMQLFYKFINESSRDKSLKLNISL